MQKPDRLRFLRIARWLSFCTILGSCVTDPDSPHPDDPLSYTGLTCSFDELPFEPDWIFLSCEASNKSDAVQEIVFAPRIPEEHPFLHIPEPSDIVALEKRIKARNASGLTGPLAGPGAVGSGRLDAFLLPLAATLSAITARSLQNRDELMEPRPQTLKPQGQALFLFPLLSKSQKRPAYVELAFTRPSNGSKTVPITGHAGERRRRAL